MTRVSAPSRLHFGLLHVPVDERPTWPGSLVPARWYGGVGLMIDRPGVAVRVERSDAWSAVGPSAPRALKFAQEIARSAERDQPLCVAVESCPPEHVGLGVGTQLGLAVAAAAADQLGCSDCPAAELAGAIGRGKRSHVGLLGFARGGMVLEAGRRPRHPAGDTGLSHRLDFPVEWRVVLVCPRTEIRWHGDAEDRAFRRPRSPEAALRSAERLSRLLLLGLWPAVGEADYPVFAEALYEYNREAGAAFAQDQGGVYVAPEVEGLVDTIRAWGILAAGQSSWGPTVFAVTPDPPAADKLAQRLRESTPSAEFVTVAAADNTGAVLTRCG